MTRFGRRVVSGASDDGLPGKSAKLVELGELGQPGGELGQIGGEGEVGEDGEAGEEGESKVGFSSSNSKSSFKSMSSERRVMWRGGAGVEISSSAEASAVLAGGSEVTGSTLDLFWPMIDALLALFMIE